MGRGPFGAAAPLPLGVEEGPRYTPGPRTVSILSIRHSTHCFQGQKIKRHFLTLHLGPFLAPVKKPRPREVGSRASPKVTQENTLFGALFTSLRH